MLVGIRSGQSWPRKIQQDEVPVRLLPDLSESRLEVHPFTNGGVEFDREAREGAMHFGPAGCRRPRQQRLAPRRLERVPILRRQSASRKPVQPPGPRRVTPSGLDRRCPWRHFVNPDMTAKDWIDPDDQSSGAGLADHRVHGVRSDASQRRKGGNEIGR